MNKLDMLVENQNLKKMLEIMREDVEKNCIDCKNKLPYLLRHVPENPALAHMAERCKQCVWGKYREVGQNLIDTYYNVVFVKKNGTVSL